MRGRDERGGKGAFSRRGERLSLISLSLSHTNTHTHARTHALLEARKCSLVTWEGICVSCCDLEEERPMLRCFVLCFLVMLIKCRVIDHSDKKNKNDGGEISGM